MEQTETIPEIEIPPAPPPETKSLQTKQSQIFFQEGGALRLATIEDAFRVANAIFKSRLAPKALDTPEKVMIGIMFAHELGLPIISSLRQICVINQAPAIWGELPLGIVKRSGKLEFIKEHLICEDNSEVDLSDSDAPWKAVKCIIKMKGFDPVERSFSINDAKKAGLWGKTGPWQTYPKRMCQMRARGHALKDAAPEFLSGISILEYDHNTTGDEMKDVGPSRDADHIQSKVDELNREPVQ